MVAGTLASRISRGSDMAFERLRKRLAGFARRRRSMSPTGLAQFGQSIGEVVATRIVHAMTGKLDAVEARRMVAEKQIAAVRAHIAYTQAIMNGKAATALDAYLDVYRRAVEGNRKRLCGLRKRR